MSRLPSRLLTACLAAMLLGLPAQGRGEECLSQGCHADLLTAPALHSPVAEGRCASCHRPYPGPHPGGGYPAFETADAAPLCLSCHGEKEGGKSHSLSSRGECLACHLPHGGEDGRLLSSSPRELCLKCHKDIEERMSGARIGHAPIFGEESCLACHRIHPSAEDKGERELCLSCHGKDDYRTSTPLANIAREVGGKPFLHGPVAEGRCIPCHDPHGSKNFRLLTGSYPDSLYAPFAPEAYSLCFHCHDIDPFILSGVAEVTGFRDGERNLHHLHVGDESKGRSCRSCHEPHAGTNRPLIRDEGPRFGEWRIPLFFEASPTGGSCAPGCHTAARYDRKRPSPQEESR